MSIRMNGVKFDRPKVKRGTAFLLLLGLLELTFSFFLYLSLAGHIFAPQTSEAAPGIPNLLSFQGRLTDTSGNPLGGTGTPYCFRYSIYDAVSGGNQLWPAGTPGTSTTTVVDGVYSDQIGRVDALTYDFVATSTIFLQVDVNTVTSTCSGTWEPLTPRQQLTSAPYAQTSENIYGNAIRTPTSTKVQIGTGAGVASGQTLLSLDVVNASESIGGTCNNNNGTIWYNSTLSRALVCENNTINVLSNSSTTIAGIATNASAPITAGNIVFSNSPTVTFGQNGSTITASAAGGGGGGQTITLSNFSWPSGVALTSAAHAQGSVTFGHLSLAPGYLLTATRAAILASGSISSNVAGGLSISIGLYSLNGSTLSLITGSSGGQTYSYTSNASSAVSGIRRISVPINISMTPGQYYYGIWMSTSGGGSFSIARGAGVTAAFSGNLGVASNVSRQMVIGVGVYSSSNALPASVAVSAVRGGGTAGFSGTPWILFTNLDLN